MNKTRNYQRKVKRVRAKILRDKLRPRLSVFRSNTQIYAQVIDDVKGKTLAAFSSKNLKASETKGKNKQEVAALVGESLAKKAKKKKVSKVTFDKGAYKYHGRVKALADGARKGGLIF